jgi:uncharacterized protein (DUF3084 family)
MNKIAVRMKKIAVRMKKIAIRMKKIAVRMKKIAIRMNKIAIRINKIAVRMKKIAIRMNKIAIRMNKIAFALNGIAIIYIGKIQESNFYQRVKNDFADKITIINNGLNKMDLQLSNLETRTKKIPGYIQAKNIADPHKIKYLPDTGILL